MFRSLLPAWTALAALGLASSAQAASDIEFKTSGPVLIFVDGEQATLTSKLKQRVGGLEGGTHEVRVQGMFGKTLYEAEINLPDGTVTEAEWSGRELKVLSTDWLPEDDGESDEVVAIDVPEPEPEAAPEPELPAAPPEPLEPAPELAMDPPADDLPLALPQPATALPTPTPPGKTLTVQAQDGMRVEVVHQGRTVVVTVEDGAFKIEDPHGLQIALSGH